MAPSPLSIGPEGLLFVQFGDQVWMSGPQVRFSTGTRAVLLFRSKKSRISINVKNSKKQTKTLCLFRRETWTRLSSPLKAPQPHNPWFRSDFSREEPRTPDSSVPGRPGAEMLAGKPRRGAGDAGSLSRGSAGCREEKTEKEKEECGYKRGNLLWQTCWAAEKNLRLWRSDAWEIDSCCIINNSSAAASHPRQKCPENIPAAEKKTLLMRGGVWKTLVLPGGDPLPQSLYGDAGTAEGGENRPLRPPVPLSLCLSVFGFRVLIYSSKTTF